MSTTIKLRRSAVPGRVPTTSQLELGEIAINTADGKLYFKKYDATSNTESIVDVSADLDADAILSLLSGVDGANSGLDADLLDGQDGSYYLDWANFTNTATGVIANTYGSSTAIPIITVDADGRITAANTAPVAGVDNFTWDSANNQLTLTTGDGTIYNIYLNQFKDLVVEDLTANTLNISSFTFDALDVGGDISANNAFFDGNITVGGLVDGRDIAADGAKLDLLEDGLDLTLTGKVTGTASSNTGVMTLVTELANTGVTAGVYGSATAIPVITIDEDGRITLANTSPVSGVQDFYFVDANNTITLETGDGGIYLAHINKLDRIEEDLTVTLEGKVTGTVTSNTGVMTVQTELANTGVTAGTYGSSTAIPVITVDEDGRITVANTSSVAGVDNFYWTPANNSLILQTGDGTDYVVPIDTFTDITVNDLSANNIIVSGLVDGRDIAADGSKLDGIEAGATADQTASEILTLLLTVDGDGSGLDADSVDGYSASEILDAAANTAASLVGAGEVFIYANTGVTITGDNYFNLNSANSHTIVVEHSDTSSVSDVSLSNGNVVTGITFDTFGHAQTVTSTDLDSRYYTETESDNRFVNVTGDTMTGDLTVNATIHQQYSSQINYQSTTTSFTQTVIYAFAFANYGSAEIIISAKEGSNRHMTKLLITHDGSTAIATEFGTVYTGSELANYEVAINGPVLQILAAATTSSTVTYNIVGTLIAA